MLDFSSINAFEKGQRESFERLVCLLAEREQFEKTSEFHHNEGSGGDGGVDAIRLLTDGGKIGYQAKFFLSLQNHHWRQMDNSVMRALKVHPELQKYIIALPCNLTSNRGENNRGKSEREKWDEKVQAWKNLAKEKSLNIEFELWSASTLENKLLREENKSIKEHWFGGDLLDDDWFKQHLEATIQVLDDRFNPDDHVEVSIETLFDAIERGPGISSKLKDVFDKLKDSKIPNIEFTDKELAPDVETLSIANETWQELVEFKHSFTCNFFKPWDIDSIMNVLNRLRDAVIKLEKRYRLIVIDEKISKNDQKEIKKIRQKLINFTILCRSMREIFESQNFRAEASQCALIHGPAGAGKSHVLAQTAKQRTDRGLPTVLFLGQDFSDAPLWEQIGKILGLDSRTAEDVLGALNAAGERKKNRTVLLFDAINEGVGFQYWKQNLPRIVHAIKNYPHLAAVFSCREEYVPYAIPKNLLEKLPQFGIIGFSTSEEFEQAAKRYLDIKGIARPNTPWLSPEFRNPLFLKTVSESLQAKGETEFPRGLQGISKIMALYLDALSERTGVNFTDRDAIINSIKECIQLVADNMASEGRDFIELKDATNFAEKCFEGRRPPQGKTWLQVLIEVNLFRRDIQLYHDGTDDLNPPPELVRFTFQRFQDYLMAKSLVAKIKKTEVTKTFNKDGPLNFLFYDGEPNQSICYEYAGLVGALSTIFPEEFGIEFAKSLPDWKRQWEENHLLQEGFAESFKWRSADAFLEDARELFSLLDDYQVDQVGLLLEVSMTTNHPFNALYLHSRLAQLDMPKRDSEWTNRINWAYREENNQVDRIISWALSLISHERQYTDTKHLELASVILTWFLSSSYRTLRDRATKALTTAFLIDPSIFDFVLEKMHNCNDPYVIERLYAAAFGACCIDPTPERLKVYSSAVFAKVFKSGQPPVALLTRDYALGIIEIAESEDALSGDVFLKDCYHPFKSDAPVFGLTTQEVESIAKERGGNEIFSSASSEWGDFGKYSIPGRIENFLVTPLNQPKPISKEELKRIFVKEVISPHDERVAILEEYEKVKSSYVPSIIFISSTENTTEQTVDRKKAENEALKHKETLDDIRNRLENKLNKKEKERLSTEYFRDSGDNENFDKIDVQQCRLWITKRAYELGWNSELFPRDGDSVFGFRQQDDFERIGKKYQRIALDEIQARLADNYWTLEDHWFGEPCVYRYSHDNFNRNLEPTILPTNEGYAKSDYQRKGWIIEPIIKLPEVAETDLKRWPFEEDPAHSIEDKLERIDENDKRWLILYEHNAEGQQYQEPHLGEHGMRYQEFRSLYCVFLRRGKTSEMTKFLKTKSKLDVFSFKPREFTDGPYFREAHWRDTWHSEKFYEHLQESPDGCDFANPTAHYYWEKHLDKTLPEGFSNYMPQKWFADELALSRQDFNTWVNQNGEELIQTYIRSRGIIEHQTAVVIDKDTLFAYSKKFDVEPIWLMIAERNVWPAGSNTHACWRRSEAVIWHDGKSWRKFNWLEDTKR